MKGCMGWTGALGALVMFGLSGAVHAQVYPGTAGSWSGYAPGYSWGTYAPAPGWVGYAPQVAVPPGSVANSPNVAGWRGYAPQRSWVGYVPQSGWTGYVPAGGWRTVSSAPVVTTQPRPYRGWGTVNGRVTSAYREFGSGRPVPLHKPWLPGSP